VIFSGWLHFISSALEQICPKTKLRNELIINLRFWLDLFFGVSTAQKPVTATAADIHDDIKRLNVLASALFVAAHPDDENTRMISWLSNKMRARTAVLIISPLEKPTDIIPLLRFYLMKLLILSVMQMPILINSNT